VRAADLFATALERLGNGSPPPELTEAARGMGVELAGASGRRASRTRLVETLERGGYEPFTDEHGVLRLRNCPFDALAQAHRSLVCRTNLAVAEGMAEATRTELEPILDPQPGTCCVAFRRPEGPVTAGSAG
jgi:predicted ArsR family transcriptional regulator